MIEVCDCIVIGGGPAGLTAAIYLARFRHKVILFDTNHSRAKKIPISKNYPVFPKGISGKDILRQLKLQLSFYKVLIIREKVTNLSKIGSDQFFIQGKKKKFIAKNVILATGVEDIEPNLPNIKKGIQRRLIHHCPICDGFELIDKKIAIICEGKLGLEEAIFIRDYTPHVTLINKEPNTKWSKSDLRKLNLAAIRLINSNILELELLSNSLKIHFEENEILEVDSIYCALGCIKHNSLGNNLKAQQKKGLFVVDKNQQTSVKGLYAAGDIVSNLHQLCVAEGQAAIAATAIRKNNFN